MSDATEFLSIEAREQGPVFVCRCGAVLGDAMLHKAGGWVGLVCGALAMYGSFALVTNATYGREVVPVGSR